MNETGTKSMSKYIGKLARMYTLIPLIPLIRKLVKKKRNRLIEKSIQKKVIMQDGRVVYKETSRSVSIRLSREDMAKIYSRALELSEKSI